VLILWVWGEIVFNSNSGTKIFRNKKGSMSNIGGIYVGRKLAMQIFIKFR
jgi:hypothetical protein